MLLVPMTAHAASLPRLIIGFKSNTPAHKQASTISRASVIKKTTTLNALDAAIVSVQPRDLAKVRKQLLARNDVAYVEIDHIARAYDAKKANLTRQSTLSQTGTWIPSDTFFTQQWALSTIRATSAWEHTRGSGITIAILDTGVDYIHPDLRGRVDLGRDFIAGDADPMDEQGHGTHVAGIAAANADDRFGIAGVAPSARILAIRVLDAEGAGNYSQVAQGITYAADNGAKIINLSLGGPEKSELLRTAIDYAASRGAIVTCASGNEGSRDMGYPARYDSCLSVGATDITDTIAQFSNRGTGLDITAPGTQILSSVIGASHDSWDGTSMATPHVAGAAALLMSQGLSRSATLSTLLSSAVDLGAAGYDTTYGAGRLDVAAAVDAALRSTRSLNPDATTPSITAISLAPPQKTTHRKVSWRWIVKSRSAFNRVGTSRFAGEYQYTKYSRKGNRRTADTFRFRNGIVYRRRVVHQRTRKLFTTRTVTLPIMVQATDDVGVDRVSFNIDGHLAGVDWSNTDGWSLTTTCASGTHTFTATAWDEANNNASATITRRVTC